MLMVKRGITKHIVQVVMEGSNEDAFSLSNMMVLGRLGRGGTSHVFRAQSTRSKRLYAMKVIDKKARTYHRHTLEKQLAIHRRLSHPSVVRLEGHIEDCDNHYVLTEYCQSGEMTRLLTEKLSEQVLAGVLWQVTVGLAYVHGQGVAHCDLKLSNLLIQEGRIKICDFGFSQNITESISAERPICGTIYYMAPEILKQKRRLHCKQGDVWALGICLLILITKKQPYSGETFQQLRKQIIAGEREKLPSLSQQLQDLMARLLQMQPEKRITLQEVLAHPFLLKHSSSLNKPIILSGMLPRQQKISKVEEVTNLVSQNEAEEADTPPVIAKQKLEEKEWSFKRNKSKTEIGSDETLERKMTKGQSRDNEKTVRQTKKKEQQKPLQNEEKIQKQQSQIAYNPLIDAPLIKPFEQFHYQTKNDGFIKISKNGQLSIKVKNIIFQITPDGQILQLNNKNYTLSEMQSNPIACKQPLDLYTYARQVMNLMKSKHYAATWRERHGEANLLLAISLDWKRVKCIRTAKGQSVLLEWTKGEEQCKVRKEGEKSVKKDICELSEQLRDVFLVMKVHLCPPEGHDQQ